MVYVYHTYIINMVYVQNIDIIFYLYSIFVIIFIKKLKHSPVN